MIGVDTNVLVRLFVSDDRRQHQLARQFFAARNRDDPAFVSVVTAVEFVWVLTRTYKRPPAEVLSMLQRIVASEDAVVESVDRVREAIEVASAAGADLSDVLIATAGARAGAAVTVTFDQPAASLVPGMELLR